MSGEPFGGGPTPRPAAEPELRKVRRLAYPEGASQNAKAFGAALMQLGASAQNPCTVERLAEKVGEPAENLKRRMNALQTFEREWLQSLGLTL